MRTIRTLIAVLAATATWSPATAVSDENAPEQRPSCLQVISGAFGDVRREEQRVLLQAIAAQLHMSPERLAKTLTEAHGNVNQCFNLLSDRAR